MATALEIWLDRGEDDATWVLTSSFVILTMQSGFGLLESGCMPDTFGANIMMKNVMDVLFGGLSYWFAGYGFSYGTSFHGLFGTSSYFVNTGADPNQITAESLDDSVDTFSHYIFQFTFAATATTIVSGAVAGRLRFSTYIVFSFFNTLLYSIPAHWQFHEDGWLAVLGAIDFAGDGPVHLLGALNGLVGARLLGPRKGWPNELKVHNGATNSIFGLFLLWWGWLGFNCGSTFGITGHKWLIASRVAVTTINASIGGGVFGVLISFALCKRVCVEYVVNSILAGLVAITAGCAAVSPAESFIIGIIGAACSLMLNHGFIYFRVVDDPAGAIGVHGAAAIWGLLAIGIFADSSLLGGPDRSGLIYGGGLTLLGIQAIAVLSITAWTIITSLIVFKLLDLSLGLRATAEDERLGFDWSEHRIPPRDWQLEQMQIQLQHFQKKLEKLETLNRLLTQNGLRDINKVLDGPPELEHHAPRKVSASSHDDFLGDYERGLI